MNCTQCGAPIAPNVKKCPFCGNINIKKRKPFFGKISITLAISTLIIVVFLVIMFFLFGINTISFISIMSFLLVIFSIISIISGALSFFGKEKNVYGLIGLILGICFIIGIPLTTLIYTNNFYQEGVFSNHYVKNYDPIEFDINEWENSLIVVKINSDYLSWDDITIYGNYKGHSRKNHDFVMVGDEINECSGWITVNYDPTDTVLIRYYFS